MKPYVLSFQEIDKTRLMVVGGKGLNLGELSKIDGIQVPDGFCVTTEAYRKSIENNVELEALLEKLTELKSDDRDQISEISKKIRSSIENLKMAKDIENEIMKALALFGEQEAYAVRSSATAEDLPHASFAGQQDTYLNIKGKGEVLGHVIKCWASLFTDRAVTYRIQNGFDHRKVLLSVVVQKMVMSEVSGIMFTADPMTSDRKTLSIDAGFGLGEALVSGLVNPDIYKVQNGMIVGKSIGTQKLEIRPVQGGGTQELKIENNRQRNEALTDAQILHLAAIGKKIEAHFGSPQDIEWCLVNNAFYIVQSRPITTLFPIPESTDSRKPRVYMSIGHTQMMIDVIKPLGMSFFEMLSESTMDKAGGRIFTDITHDLSSGIGRNRLVMATGKQDPLIQSALKKLLEDKDFMDALPHGKRNVKGGIFTISSIVETIKIHRKNDPSIIEEILTGFEKEVREVDEQLSKLSGDQALEFIRNDRDKLLAMSYDPRMLGTIIAAILVNDSLNKNVEKWLGEKNIADALTKSLDHNVTTEMGLALCDVADTIRRFPKVLAYISNDPADESFFEEMIKLPGGKETRQAFKEFLDKYGMRCPGEIDITKARFEEKPTQLIPMLLNNIRVLESGEHVTRFQKGKQEAKVKEEEIICRLKNMAGGDKKAKKIRKSIRLLRNFIGCREYPKYYIVRRYQVYKKALMKEADRLVNKGVIKNREDIFYLYFDELCQVVKTNELDYSIIKRRRDDYVHYEKLTPPRVITSDGFVPTVGLSSDNMPKGAISGIPVSSGVVEGRARVVLSVDEAKLEEGDILVTQFTDPSWTPLFVTIKGLVTEVGGFTTHGAVITREYGLPGVVGVENATKLIKDGQRIRVNGTEGYVEILE
ncbi:pyruvate,water dikinase [Anaerosolibacter carboniphilus]|uniref:Rifampicin phosphotransferase n=1 Tax=Anaerosolibacter carboniphilus TaxID=1417629 RepID=A0A841KLB8_9FIRM|nr:phosphoenolpyruvate synthase [Anaerosolibacter carboniphilus]MBB6214247.1 pyruvate,water dikinase [Anaerosolibacter carboniphilus]